MPNARQNILIAIMVALLPASLAAAEPSAAQKPDRPGSAKVLPLRNAHTIDPCAAYGAGFVRVEGTDTCVKIGGAVSIGVGVR